MDLGELEIPCGYCDMRGCVDCGGTGYLIASPEAERLLAFVLHQIGPLIGLGPGASAHRTGEEAGCPRGAGAAPGAAADRPG